jgi:uncharacterized repeat protein (TIGR03803 family)
MRHNEFRFIASWQAALVAILMSAISAFAAGGTKYNVIYRFQGGTDAAIPVSPLIVDQAGNLYGTTQNGGGSGNCFEGCGTVFRFKPPATKGGAWKETILHSFTGDDGYSPTPSPLVFDQAGRLYGAAANNIFQLTPPKNGHGAWTETVVYTFTNRNDGGHPNGVIFDSAGNLFGTTQNGGQYGQQGAGTIFELTPKGNTWTETTLYSFQLIKDGNHPGALVFDSKGNLYGTNSGDSVTCTPKFPRSCGAVFELELKGGSWQYKVIHAFQGFNDASYPNFSALVFDQSGNLYGTSVGTGGTGDVAGQDSEGTVFELTPPATQDGSWTETLLHHFPRPGGIDGSNPIGDVVFDPSGNLYGVTFYGAGNTKALCVGRGCGIVFELKPPTGTGGSWEEIHLHDFTVVNDGANPFNGLLLGPGTTLFGTTSSGGGSSACQDGCGTVFEIVP